MCWAELERLVLETEAYPAMPFAFQPCRSRKQLILQAWRHGYRITRTDLLRALQ